MSFEGKTVLITGATSGIGRETAALLSARGAKVIVSGRDEQRGAKVAAATGGRFIRADLTVLDEVRALAAHAGEVDVLVNNAGSWELLPTGEATEAGFAAMVDVNLRAPFFLTAALAPAMAARGGGAVVNVSTMVAARGAAGMAGYAATKAGLEAMTLSRAAEYGPAGVRVNAVALGPSKTDGTEAMSAMRDALASASPLQRANEAAEVAATIAFLAGDDASAVTSVVLAVDGGRVAALGGLRDPVVSPVDDIPQAPDERVLRELADGLVDLLPGGIGSVAFLLSRPSSRNAGPCAVRLGAERSVRRGAHRSRGRSRGRCAARAGW